MKTYGNKLAMKADESVRLFFENVNGILLEIEYCKTLWKYRRLQNTWSIMQADIMSLLEIKINK